MPERKSSLTEILLVVSILLGYFALTLPTLAWWPPFRYDEAWIGSVANELVTNGRFATPLFGDYLDLNELSLDRFPLHSLIQATFLSFLGFGIWQLRLPGVLMGAGIVLAVLAILRAWLGWRWALVGASILVFASIGFAEPIWAPGLSSVSTNGRHDVTVAFFSTWSLWAFFRSERERSYPYALLAWVLVGCAVLTHPYALILPLLLILSWAANIGPDDLSLRQRLRCCAGLWAAGLLLLPWAALLATHWQRASRQLATFNGAEAVGAKLGRFSFFRPEFYLSNLLREPTRYQKLAESVSQGLFPALFVGLCMLGLARVYIRARDAEPAFLAVALPAASLLLATFESWKYASYLTLLLPMWVMAAVYGWAWAHEAFKSRFGSNLLSLVLASVLILSSIRTISAYFVTSRQYDTWPQVEAFLSENVLPQSVTVGSMVFWPAFRGSEFYDYQSPTLRVRRLWYVDKQESLAEWFSRVRPEFVIFDDSWQRWAFDLKTPPYGDADTRKQLKKILDEDYQLVAERAFQHYGTVRILKANK